MSHPINPINPGFIDNVQFHPDTAHGPYPAHMDVRIRLDDGLCQKLRIDKSGNLLSDDLEFGNRFLR